MTAWIPRHLTDLAFASGLAVGMAFLWASGMASESREAAGSNDFSGYWAISRTLLDGGDPYRPGALDDIASRYGTQPLDEPISGQPPWTVLAMVPLAALDVRVAAAVWLIIGVAIAVLGVRALLRACVPALPLVHFGAGLVLAGAPASLFTVYAGQWTFLLTGVLSWCVVLLRSGRETAAAVAAIGVLAKPHLFLFAAWALAAHAWSRGRYRFIGLAAGIGALAVAAAWLALPQWWDAWFAYVPQQRLPVKPRTSNSATLFFDLLGPVGLFLAAALLLVAVFMGLRRFRRDTDEHLAYWIALSLVAAPYSWGYDQTLLIVPIVITAGVVAQRSGRLATAVAMAAFAGVSLGSLAVWSFNPTTSGSPKAVVGILVFTVILCALWPRTAALRLRSDLARPG